jgi:hypothetical protein
LLSLSQSLRPTSRGCDEFNRRFDSPDWWSKRYIRRMSYVTVEVKIEHGRIVAREPEKLPEKGNGLLTILPTANAPSAEAKPARQPPSRAEVKKLLSRTPAGRHSAKQAAAIVERALAKVRR